VRLAQDVDNFLPPPTSLVSGTVTTSGAFAYTSTDLTTFVPESSVLITAGTRYWLVLTPHSDTTLDSWEFNSIGKMGRFALSGDGVNWGQNPSDSMYAFQINLAPVPEPSSLMLAAAGLVVLASSYRRHPRSAR
jgi:hypothetical protein